MAYKARRNVGAAASKVADDCVNKYNNKQNTGNCPTSLAIVERKRERTPAIASRPLMAYKARRNVGAAASKVVDDCVKKHTTTNTTPAIASCHLMAYKARRNVGAAASKVADDCVK